MTSYRDIATADGRIPPGMGLRNQFPWKRPSDARMDVSMSRTAAAHVPMPSSLDRFAPIIATVPPDARDNQTQKIQERIANVEKHFGEMCQLFAAYVRKKAKLRDKGDMLVREIGLYADTETPNLRDNIKQFMDHLAKIQDYRHAAVERLDAKVLEPLKSYRSLVKQQRVHLKNTQSARLREARQMAQLERTRLKNPSDSRTISKAESELHRATVDATRTTRQLEETIDEFEKLKLQDIKKIFSDFTLVEMLFHAKALEIYTMAYQSIQCVQEDEEEDDDQEEGRIPFQVQDLDLDMNLNMHRPIPLRSRKEEEDEDDDESEDESDDVIYDDCRTVLPDKGHQIIR